MAKLCLFVHFIIWTFGLLYLSIIILVVSGGFGQPLDIENRKEIVYEKIRQVGNCRQAHILSAMKDRKIWQRGHKSAKLLFEVQQSLCCLFHQVKLSLLLINLVGLF